MDYPPGPSGPQQALETTQLVVLVGSWGNRTMFFTSQKWILDFQSTLKMKTPRKKGLQMTQPIWKCVEPLLLWWTSNSFATVLHPSTHPLRPHLRKWPRCLSFGHCSEWPAQSRFGCVWKWLVPLNPMVLLIIIPFLNGYFIGNPIFRQTLLTLWSLDWRNRRNRRTDCTWKAMSLNVKMVSEHLAVRMWGGSIELVTLQRPCPLLWKKCCGACLAYYLYSFIIIYLLILLVVKWGLTPLFTDHREFRTPMIDHLVIDTREFRESGLPFQFPDIQPAPQIIPHVLWSSYMGWDIQTPDGSKWEGLDYALCCENQPANLTS